MDFVPAVVPPHGGDRHLLDRINDTRNTVRDNASIDVVHVRVQFCNGTAEVDRGNRIFATAAYALTNPDDKRVQTTPSPSVTATSTSSRNASAPSPESDLDLLLRARGIRTKVLAGVATSGVVLSTVRHAADLDHRIVVLEDGCADSDHDLHTALMRKVFPAQADVMTIAQWIETTR